MADATGPKHINTKYTRTKLETIVEPLIQKALKPCNAALESAGLKVSDVNEVTFWDQEWHFETESNVL